MVRPCAGSAAGTGSSSGIVCTGLVLRAWPRPCAGSRSSALPMVGTSKRCPVRGLARLGATSRPHGRPARALVRLIGSSIASTAKVASSLTASRLANVGSSCQRLADSMSFCSADVQGAAGENTFFHEKPGQKSEPTRRSFHLARTQRSAANRSNRRDCRHGSRRYHHCTVLRSGQAAESARAYKSHSW